MATLPPQLFQDDQILVVNKPAGLIVEDSHTHNQATLQTALPQDELLDRNGLVHRLDRDTSGVMVVAQSPEAQANLQQQFKDRTTTKEYQALVWGKPKDTHFIIDAPIGRHPRYGYKFIVDAEGRPAKTEVWWERSYSYQGQPVSLLRVRPYSGRTHQIRVHLAAMRLPIIGDKIYGRRKDNSPIRQFLHAQRLEFDHPLTGERLHFEAPLADDLQQFLDSLSQ